MASSKAAPQAGLNWPCSPAAAGAWWDAVRQLLLSGHTEFGKREGLAILNPWVIIGSDPLTWSLFLNFLLWNRGSIQFTLPAAWADKLPHESPVCPHCPLPQLSHCSQLHSTHTQPSLWACSACLLIAWFTGASYWSFGVSCCRFLFTESHFLNYWLRPWIWNFHFYDKIWFLSHGVELKITLACLQHCYNLQGVIMQLKFLLYSFWNLCCIAGALVCSVIDSCN